MTYESIVTTLNQESKKYTMSDLSKMSGVEIKCLYPALNVGAQPRLKTIIKIADALGFEIKIEKIKDGTSESKLV